MADELIHKKMAAILAEIGAVKKASTNSGQHWQYRSIDDVMGALHPLLAKHGVYILPEVRTPEYSEFATGSGKSMNVCRATVAYHFVAEDGSRATLVTAGEGADRGDKSTSKALAIAMKYAITQAFCVPTDDAIDPDAEINEFSSGSQRVSAETVEKLFTAIAKNGYTDEQILAMGRRNVKHLDELTEGEAQKTLSWVKSHPRAEQNN
jgi:hypothetical protein